MERKSFLNLEDKFSGISKAVSQKLESTVNVTTKWITIIVVLLSINILLTVGIYLYIHRKVKS